MVLQSAKGQLQKRPKSTIDSSASSTMVEAPDPILLTASSLAWMANMRRSKCCPSVDKLTGSSISLPCPLDAALVPLDELLPRAFPRPRMELVEERVCSAIA